MLRECSALCCSLLLTYLGQVSPDFLGSITFDNHACCDTAKILSCSCLLHHHPVSCILVQAAEARSHEAILPCRDTAIRTEANSSKSRPAATHKMVNGPRTVSPATHNGSVVTCDPPTNPKPTNPAALRGGPSTKGRPTVEKGDANPATYALSPPMGGTTPYSGGSAGGAVAHRAPPADGYHGGGYERQRVAREHAVASRGLPSGVEVLEVRSPRKIQ